MGVPYIVQASLEGLGEKGRDSGGQPEAFLRG